MTDYDEIEWGKAALKTTFTTKLIELMAEGYLQICFNFPQIIEHICNCVVFLLGIHSVLKKIFRTFNKFYIKS